MSAILLSGKNLFQDQASVFQEEVRKDTCPFYHLENTTEPALAPLTPSPPPEDRWGHSTQLKSLPTPGPSEECTGPSSLAQKHRLGLSTHGWSVTCPCPPLDSSESLGTGRVHCVGCWLLGVVSKGIGLPQDGQVHHDL